MSKIISVKIVAFLMVFTSFSLQAKEAEAGEEKDLKTGIKEYINHHLEDSYDFSLYSYTTDEGEHVYVGFPLPVILIDEGLKIFSSSKFNHGEDIAEVDGNYYTIYHSKIYKTDAQGTVNLDEDGHIINDRPLDFSITKSVVGMILISLLMVWIFSRLARSYKKNGQIPTGFGRFMEPIILYVRDDIAIPNIGEKHYKKYMSFLLTIFFFIWFLNLAGMTPLGINVTGNISVTFGLALLVFLITNLTANRNYWGHIFWMPGVPTFMKVVLAPIELLGVVIKPFSLMIRLWANMSAGHIVLMSIIGLMFIFQNWIGSSLSFVLAFVLSILELLVAALQAYIFTMLAALYFGFANEEAH